MVDTRVKQVKQRIKDIAYRTGVSSGFTDVINVADRTNRTGLYVFSGHHVVPDDSNASVLTAQRLYDRLTYLHKHFDVVSVEQAIDWLEDPGPKDRLAAVTFDDGYRDNLTVALEVLRATSVPATVFVATEPILSGRPFWFDAVRRAVAIGARSSRELPWIRGVLDRIEERGANVAADELVRALNQDRPGLREMKVAELIDALDYSVVEMPPHLQPLSPDELTEFAQDPLVSIGAHTHRHSLVTSCTNHELRCELTENVAALERLTGERPIAFAYPKGATDSSPDRIAELLTELKVKAAFTTKRRINRDDPNRWMLGRFPLGDGPVSTFAWELMQLSF